MPTGESSEKHPAQPAPQQACLATTTTAADDKGSKDPTLVTVAGAVASGLGVLGFVTFAGGVVLWSRFKGMGLPADHAVSLVPKPELVATGAEFLMKALLFTAFVVVVVVVTSLRTRGSAPPDEENPDPGSVRVFWIPALVGVAEAAYAVFGHIPVGVVFLLWLVAAVSGFVVSACSRLKTSVYCLVAFLSVGTFAMAYGYEHTTHHLEVLPMAYSRSQSHSAARVEIGYFVAETSDRIVFASVPGDPQNELREFPRNETDDLEVGALTDTDQAPKVAARFALNLCHRLLALEEPQQTEVAAKQTGSTSKQTTGAKKPVCSKEYLTKLQEDSE